jgi:signal transduction histidine kinase
MIADGTKSATHMNDDQVRGERDCTTGVLDEDPTTRLVKSRALQRVGIVMLMVAVITIAHLTLPRSYVFLHSTLQHLYYLPIILGAVFFGWWGGLLTAICTAFCYLPHIHGWQSVDHDYALNQYAELGSFFLVGIATGLLADRERRKTRQLEQKSAELERANRNLEESVDRVRQADRLASVGQLAAGLAHEMRHPLASIDGAVNVLANPQSPDDLQEEFRGILRKECRRLGGLLTELLHFATPRTPNLQRISVEACVQEVVMLARSSITTPGVEIQILVPDDLPLVECDEEQMRQVLMNLVMNGLQATPVGGRVTVRARLEGSLLALVVSDNGPGVPDNLKDRVFDPFFTTRESGTGLGLAVVQQIVKQHGGTIDVDGDVSGGASFTVRIPIQNKGIR